jgi:glutamine synthetase
MSDSAKTILKHDQGRTTIEWVDLRFTDPKGKWQHLAHHGRLVMGEDELDRRPDVRRLLDRGLEGDQRIRHDPQARTSTPSTSIRSAPRR